MIETNIIYDKAGFPLIKLAGLDFWIHALPVTKIQFERFICDKPSDKFDEDWYKTVTADDINPRVSPRKVEMANYWQLFLTGVKPSEAMAYAEWCGQEFDLPSFAEWSQAFEVLRQLQIDESAFLYELGDLESVLFRNLEGIVKQIYERDGKKLTGADHLLMRYGVMEWVTDVDRRNKKWRAMGYPDSKFYKSGLAFNYLSPIDPNDPEFRMRAFGFRLIKRQNAKKEK